MEDFEEDRWRVAGSLEAECCAGVLICKLGFVERWRVGATRPSVLLDDERATEGWDFGEGSAWDDKWRAGEDIEARRIDGVMKLVTPATLSFSGGGFGEGVADSLRRKVTLLSIFIFSFSCGSSLAFPFPFAVKVANSSTGGRAFFERVAVLMLCSSDDLKR